MRYSRCWRWLLTRTHHGRRCRAVVVVAHGVPRTAAQLAVPAPGSGGGGVDHRRVAVNAVGLWVATHWSRIPHEHHSDDVHPSYTEPLVPTCVPLAELLVYLDEMTTERQPALDQMVPCSSAASPATCDWCWPATLVALSRDERFDLRSRRPWSGETEGTR